MIEKVERVTKIRKIRKLGSRRRMITMRGLYYKEMIGRIFNNKKRIAEGDDVQENKSFKEYLDGERHIFDKRG